MTQLFWKLFWNPMGDGLEGMESRKFALVREREEREEGIGIFDLSVL